MGKRRTAVSSIADALQIDLLQAAEGIVRVANAAMEAAVRVVSVEAGHDPRHFALVSFGGAGGLHACDLAASLGMKRVLVPASGGVLSMVGSFLGGGSGDLIYAKQKYRDFELSLEWKISENGNSGIFYFVANEDEPAPWLTGPEMQILHNEGHKDGKIHTHRAGDLYDMIAAEPETVRGPGEWNHVLIRSLNGQVEHWLNGVKVVSFTYGGPEWDAMVAKSKFSDMEHFGKSDEGYIVLQDHSDPVWFRNLKIREL